MLIFSKKCSDNLSHLLQKSCTIYSLILLQPFLTLIKVIVLSLLDYKTNSTQIGTLVATISAPIVFLMKYKNAALI